MGEELQVIGFRVGRECFAIPIALVQEIVRVPEITAVPRAPEFVEGVINLRGRILPVVDLRKRLAEAPIEASKSNRILVTGIKNRLVGLLVDAAAEVIRLAVADIELPRDVFGNHDLSYVTGVGKHQGRLIILVDLEKMLEGGVWRRLPPTATAPACG